MKSKTEDEAQAEALIGLVVQAEQQASEAMDRSMQFVPVDGAGTKGH